MILHLLKVGTFTYLPLSFGVTLFYEKVWKYQKHCGLTALLHRSTILPNNDVWLFMPKLNRHHIGLNWSIQKWNSSSVLKLYVLKKIIINPDKRVLHTTTMLTRSRSRSIHRHRAAPLPQRRSSVVGYLCVCSPVFDFARDYYFTITQILNWTP